MTSGVSAPRRALLANTASDFDAGHEIELGGDAFALALLAAAALDVEAEAELKRRALKPR